MGLRIYPERKLREPYAMVTQQFQNQCFFRGKGETATMHVAFCLQLNGVKQLQHTVPGYSAVQKTEHTHTISYFASGKGGNSDSSCRPVAF